uniref:HMG box domain-containing protein n=1 Tax=Amphora coffeiformis TaxID=265554 RepID=A0A7S3L464_9STRA|mmetsp:Transcript_24149/g.45966  ORF Transcript_24149/g.45966 Transcript_24149/m.45966 type:complete len:404 (+) Transcript_24149:122-1333(+)
MMDRNRRDHKNLWSNHPLERGHQIEDLNEKQAEYSQGRYSRYSESYAYSGIHRSNGYSTQYSNNAAAEASAQDQNSNQQYPSYGYRTGGEYHGSHWLHGSSDGQNPSPLEPSQSYETFPPGESSGEVQSQTATTFSGQLDPLPLHCPNANELHEDSGARGRYAYQQDQQYYTTRQQQDIHMRMMQGQQSQQSWVQGGYSYHQHMPRMYYPDRSAIQQSYYGARPVSGSVPGPAHSALAAKANETFKKPQKRCRKDKDKPKRPLSAYNLFFKDEREKMIQELQEGDRVSKDSDKGDGEEEEKVGSKRRKAEPSDSKPSKKQKSVGFETMAKIIGAKWKNIDDESLQQYKKRAATEMERYREAMALYRKKRDGLDQDRDESEKSATKRSTEHCFAEAEDDDKEEE